MVTERVEAGRVAASDLAGALLAQRTQLDGGPDAAGPPRVRDVGGSTAGAVPLGDLGVQPAFVAGQHVGGVRATDHDQLGSGWAKPFDLLHTLHGVIGAERAQRLPSSSPSRAVSATARRYSFLRSGRSRPGAGCAAGERAVFAIAGDQLGAQPGGLHDA